EAACAYAWVAGVSHSRHAHRARGPAPLLSQGRRLSSSLSSDDADGGAIAVLPLVGCVMLVALLLLGVVALLILRVFDRPADAFELVGLDDATPPTRRRMR